MNFMVAAHSDVGIRKSTNQDSVLIKIADTDYGRAVLAVVCDGMGGLAKGELASATMIRLFSRWFQEEFPEMLYRGVTPEELKSKWEVLILDANDKLSQYGDVNNAKLGTTAVALLIVDDKYYIINVGDSRAYMLDNGIRQITKDQTYVQREMDMGRMTYEESLKDPKRNVLLQCVGASSYIEPDFYLGKVPDQAVFVLCSDGFRHVITEDEIYQNMSPNVLGSERVMIEASVRLIELNKYRREDDNISVALIKASKEGLPC